MLIESVGLQPPQPRDYESYVWDLPVTKHLLRQRLRLAQPVTIIVGDNGAGKSTFIEALAVAAGFPGVGGRIARRDKAFTGTESCLSRYLTIRPHGNIIQRGYFLRAETHMQLLALENTAEERAGRNVIDHEHDMFARSHGESIFDVIGEHVHGGGLYIFDEPEAGLTVIRQMALLAEVAQAARKGAQFVIATHSPVLMAIPGAQIYCIGEGGIVEQAYEETEAVAATREFFDDVPGTVRFIIDGE